MFSTMMLLILAGGSWQYTETDIFQPIRKGEVVVHPNGSVYINNFSEATLHHVDQDGKRIRTIGRKGKGPGEFTFPRYINFTDGKLYVFDLLSAQISIFDEDGSFIERVETPDRGLSLAKGAQGWIYGTWSTFSPPGEGSDKADLIWVDDTFKNAKTILNTLDKGDSEGSRVFQDGTNVHAVYAPINTRPLMVNDSNYAYISHPTEPKIYVFDFEQQKLLAPIEFEHRPIPFDTDWADEQFEASFEGRDSSDIPKSQWKKAYPEKFPAIREMFIDPDGNLVVDRWRGRPNDNHFLLTLNRKGETLENKYDHDFLNRYLGQSSDGYFYIAIFDVEEEMAGVARVSRNDAVAFAKQNPIKYDGDSGYSITISN